MPIDATVVAPPQARVPIRVRLDAPLPLAVAALGGRQVPQAAAGVASDVPPLAVPRVLAVPRGVGAAVAVAPLPVVAEGRGAVPATVAP